MSQDITAIRFDIQDIGKHVKGSKKRFSWTFGLNNRNHTIILDFSFISGKVKLVVDRKTILQTQLPANTSFQHPFTLDGYALNILQQGQTFQLRINNKVFSHLYNQAKTNTQFKNYQDQVKDIKVDESTFTNTGKTVKLNIGALDGGKKRNKNTAQSQNWDNFGGSQMGIPSYFGQTSSTSTGQSGSVSTNTKKIEQKKKSLLDQDQEQTTSKSSQGKIQEKKLQTKKSGEVDFFANETSQPTTTTSPSQQHMQNLLNQPTKQQEFNTMQNMFATMNIQGGVQQGQGQGVSSLDLLSSATAGQQGQGNDFNTMQNLFATGMPGQQQGGIQNLQGIQTMQGINLGTPTSFPSPNQFSTMQNLFATGVQPGSIPTTGTAGTGVVNFPSPTQFNTMQNLFATGMGMPVTSQQSSQQSSQLTGISSVSGISSINYQTGTGTGTGAGMNTGNYNTMQNLFATQNQAGGLTMAQMQANPSALNINLQTGVTGTGASDYNTMQNLFATQNQPQGQTQVQAQGQANMQNINIQDYNTMQNLFKTGGVQLTPPTTTTTGNTSVDPFDVLGQSPSTTPITLQASQQKVQIKSAQINPNNAHQMMFNTYSGTKTAQTVDASNFGTMQKGQPGQLGSIDFFAQPTNTTQQQPEVPNFSKKKQPLEEDLI